MNRRAGDRRSLGLSGLTGQVFRKVTKKGFEFCLMVAGETGLGKSTLINSLFLTDSEIDDIAARTSAHSRIDQTVQVVATSKNITEGGVQLKLTIVDTPGFSDAVNNTECWRPVVEYINEAYASYLQDESQVDRTKIVDYRVHCLLYFINPSGRGLKPVDIETMKALHTKVNIVPLIAKADTLTQTELAALKKTIKAQVEDNGINLYVPAVDEEDAESIQEHVQTVDSMPFAVVGSSHIIDVAGKSARGRVYPWGVVEVDNPDHCDFQRLRDMIVRTHLQDLKDATTEDLYERFRSEALAQMGGEPMARQHPSNASSVQSAALEESLSEHERMKRELGEQQRLLDEKRKAFEEERLRFEAQMKQSDSRRGSQQVRAEEV